MISKIPFFNILILNLLAHPHPYFVIKTEVDLFVPKSHKSTILSDDEYPA